MGRPVRAEMMCFDRLSNRQSFKEYLHEKAVEKTAVWRLEKIVFCWLFQVATAYSSENKWIRLVCIEPAEKIKRWAKTDFFRTEHGCARYRKLTDGTKNLFILTKILSDRGLLKVLEEPQLVHHFCALRLRSGYYSQALAGIWRRSIWDCTTKL